MKKIKVFCLLMLIGMAALCVTTSCEKDDEDEGIVYRYWESNQSYVQCNIPGFVFQLNKVARTENGELEIEYTLTNKGYDYNVGTTFYTSEHEPAIRDNTGRTYMTKMPRNGDYLATIDGSAFGMYGQGVPCTFRPNAPVLGRVLIHNFSQSATSIWMTIWISSSDLDINRRLEFVNVPIEDDRTSYTIVENKQQNANSSKK